MFFSTVASNSILYEFTLKSILSESSFCKIHGFRTFSDSFSIINDHDKNNEKMHSVLYEKQKTVVHSIAQRFILRSSIANSLDQPSCFQFFLQHSYEGFIQVQ